MLKNTMKFENNMPINIVGNGVAGWIAALYLVDAGENVKLYSDPNVVIRKIGESTIPVINEISTILGISDEELVARSNGYFKYGNIFNGWGDKTWFYYPGNEENNLETTQRQTFSYHIDAPEFCKIIKEYCETQPNFTLILRNFTLDDYNKNEFFVDASGENGILSKHIGITHIDSELLINDYAIIGNGAPVYAPYTESQTMSAGWLWSISLQSRMSYGYVFSSKFQSIEDAKYEFTKTTGIQAESVIKFKSRRPVQQWVDNVVAIGISAGFIEPLNATANFIAQASVKQLIKLRNKPKVFNRLMNKTFEGIYKWVRALYGLNTTTGDYWQYYRDNYKEQAIQDVNFYSVNGHQGLMSKHSWNLLKKNMT